MKLGSYTLIKKLAEGGVADIYLAKTQSTGGKEKYLVCKCLRQTLTEDADFLSSIINEAQCTTRLRHPNVLEVFDLCCCDGHAFLTMEYMDAQDFSKLIVGNTKREETVPYDLAVYAISQVALGLHAAHELNDACGQPLRLVHRDVSPENILFGSGGEIKIGDFGIAKTAQMPDVTPPDIVKGKFNYMSPEQAWADRLDRRSDIFSLAAVLYEATTGRCFYPADSIEDCITCARMAMYEIPHSFRSDFPQDLEDVMLKALDLDKNNRYATALGFKAALDEVAKKNKWHVTVKDWIKYLKTRVVFPDEPLLLLHANEVCKDKMSVLSADEPPDIHATSQISPDELNAILAQSQLPSSISHVIGDLPKASGIDPAPAAIPNPAEDLSETPSNTCDDSSLDSDKSIATKWTKRQKTIRIATFIILVLVIGVIVYLRFYLGYM